MKKFLNKIKGFKMILFIGSLGICFHLVGAQSNVDVKMVVPESLTDPVFTLAYPGDSQVALEWNKVDSPDLTDQILYVSDDGGLTFFQTIHVGTTESLTVYGLTNGITYLFKIVSVDYLNRLSTPGDTIQAIPSNGGPNTEGGVCGNNIVELGEECDDGNIIDNDGCSSTCQAEPHDCGNSILEATEECDDGNLANGDGCSSVCLFEDLNSHIIQPVLDIFKVPDITLDLVVNDPQSKYDLVRIYLSHNGGDYELVKSQTDRTQIDLTGLADGLYSGYSVAVDTSGNTEIISALADATFIIDLLPKIILRAYPEKRVPKQGNWTTRNPIKIYDNNGNVIYETAEVITSDGGLGITEPGEIIPNGVFDISFKGLSHLNKFIRSVDLIKDQTTMLDFTFTDTFDLLAGDVHLSKDNYVNGLDLSSLVIELWNGYEEHSDLNRDFEVNGMDLSIAVANILEWGEVF